VWRTSSQKRQACPQGDSFSGLSDRSLAASQRLLARSAGSLRQFGCDFITSCGTQERVEIRLMRRHEEASRQKPASNLQRVSFGFWTARSAEIASTYFVR